MIRILNLLIFALLLTGSASGAPRAAAQDHAWRLADADQIASGDHIILTVALSTRSDLEVLAAEIAESYDVALAAEWPLRAISVHCFVMDASGHEDVGALVRRMQADGRIRTAQRMQGFQVHEPRALDDGGYRDPLFPYQIGFQRMNALRVGQPESAAVIEASRKRAASRTNRW